MVNGHPEGTEMVEGSGDKILEKALPRARDHTRPMLFELSVVRGFDPYPDPRDLGIIAPFSGAIEVRRRRKSGGTNGIGWWTAWDSNPRPRRCERRALPAELAAHSSRLLHYNRARPDVRHPQPGCGRAERLGNAGR